MRNLTGREMRLMQQYESPEDKESLLEKRVVLESDWTTRLETEEELQARIEGPGAGLENPILADQLTNMVADM